jgi:O-antigen/teichoic acid export membrane protein
VRSFLRSSGFVLFLLLQRGLPFLLLPFVALWLTQSEYGEAAATAATAGLLGALVSLGLGGSLPRLAASHTPISGWPRLFAIQLLIAVSLLILGLAGAVFGQSATVLGFPMTLFFAGLALAGSTALLVSLTGLNIARGSGGRAALAGALYAVAGAIALFVLGPAGGAASYLLALTLAGVAATAVLLPLKLRTPGGASGSVWAAFKISAPFMAQNVASWVVGLSDRLIVALVLGATSAGIYQASYMLGSILAMVSEGLQASWARAFYRSTHPGKHGSLRGLANKSVLLALGGAGLSVVALPIVATWLLPGYELNLAVVALLAASSIPRSLYFIHMSSLMDVLKSGQIAKSTLIAASVTSIGMTCLAIWPQLGILWAAGVTFGAFFSQAIYVGYRSLVINSKRDFMWGAAINSAVAIAVCSMLTLVEVLDSGLRIGVSLVLLAAFLTAAFEYFRVVRALEQLWSSA